MPARGETLCVEVDGGHVHVECHGDGPPLTMLHGWSLDRRSFQPQVAALSKQFRLIVPDRRGFGRSGAPPDMHLEVDDIDRILDAAGVESTHLLGASQGGRVALRYAVTHPERVRSLVLQGAMVDGIDVADSGTDRIPLDEYVALARAGDLGEVRRRWLAHPMVTLEHADPDAEQLLARIVGDYEGRDLVGFRPESYEFPIDVLNAISTFASPVLVITGARETEARREHARRLLEHTPDGREEVLDHSGHLVNLEASERFNALVAAFCLAADSR